MPETSVLWTTHTLNRGGAEVLLTKIAAELKNSAINLSIFALTEIDPSIKGELESNNVKVLAVRDQKTLLKRAYYLWKEIRSGKYDFVHSHSPSTSIIARTAVASKIRRNKSKLITTEHSSISLYRPLIRFLDALTMAIDDRIITVSEAAKNSLPKRFRKRAVAFYHGVSISEADQWRNHRQDTRLKLGTGPDDLIIITVANFRREKDYDTLLRAFKILSDESLKYRFLIVGFGPLEESVRNRVRELGLQNTVKILGYRPDAGLLIAAADVFVLSSFIEGLPVVLMEAVASGIPSVATDVGGVGEIIRNYVDGILVTPQNPADMAQAISRVANDKELWNKLSINCLQRREQFNVVIVADFMKQIYSE
jgi:glycosyltransferase involved in cell wall biosynthesis